MSVEPGSRSAFRRPPCVGATLLAGALLAAAPLRGRAITEEQLYTILREKDIPFDMTAARQSAVQGLLRAVDPRARLITSSDPDEGPKAKSVRSAEEWGGGICYLKIDRLDDDAGEAAVNYLRRWVEAGDWGLILDMRQAGGSSLDAVDGIASLFVEPGLELYNVETARGRVLETRRSGGKAGGLPPGWALVLLVDGSTQDGCEALAALLKGRPGVMIVGQRTLGDSGIRELIGLPGGESLWISTRRVKIGGGRDYNSVGVMPDMEASLGSAGKYEAGRKVRPLGGAHPSDTARRQGELAKRVQDDAMLGLTADALLALKAAGRVGLETETGLDR